MAEAVLAKYLAGNEKRIRDRGFKRLKKYLLARTNSSQNVFEYEDMMKLWKGLHYSMWMCDKPLVQEELADQFTRLIGLIQNEEQAMLFLDSYVATECREWFGIDKWRVDKFMMLFRKMLRSGLQYVADHGWKTSIVNKFISIFDLRVLNAGDQSPDGIKIHVVDILLEELALVGGLELTENQTMRFLEPFCSLIASSENGVLVKYVADHVFDEIGFQAFPDPEEEEQSQEDEDEDGEEGDKESTPGLKFNYTRIGDRLFALASSKECIQRNRKLLYTQVKKLRDIASGIDPYVIEDEGKHLDTDPITERRIKKATKTLAKFEKKLLEEEPDSRKRRKNAQDSETNDAESSGKKKKPNKEPNAKETNSTKSSDETNATKPTDDDKAVAFANSKTDENRSSAKSADTENLTQKKRKRKAKKQTADVAVPVAATAEAAQVDEQPENTKPAVKKRKALKEKQLLIADTKRFKEKDVSETTAKVLQPAAQALSGGANTKPNGNSSSHSSVSTKKKKKAKRQTEESCDTAGEVSKPTVKTTGQSNGIDPQVSVSASVSAKKKKSKRRKSEPVAQSGPLSALSVFNNPKARPASEPRASELPAAAIQPVKAKKQRSHQGFSVSTLDTDVPMTNVSATSHNDRMNVQTIDPLPSVAEKAGIRFESLDESTTPVFFKKAVSKVTNSQSGKKKKKPQSPAQSTQPPIMPPTPKSENRRVSFGLHRNLVQEFLKKQQIPDSPVPSPFKRPRFSILKGANSPGPQSPAVVSASPQLSEATSASPQLKQKSPRHQNKALLSLN